MANENKKIISQITGVKTDLKNKYNNRSKSDKMINKTNQSTVILDETRIYNSKFKAEKLKSPNKLS